MDGLPTIIFSFIGTLIALLITKTVETLLVREYERGETRRDLLLQLASGLTSIEGFFPGLSKDVELTSREQLAKIPSGYAASDLTIMSPERALSVDSSAKLHRMLNLFFNRRELFVRGSAEHREAYYWLLDKEPPPDWSTHAAADRVKAIKSRRDSMRSQAFEILALGYGIIEELLPLADTWSSRLMRGDPVRFLAHLDETYGLNRDSSKLRAAYYRPTFHDAFEGFDARTQYVWAYWDDDVAHALGPRSRLCVTIEHDGETKVRAIKRFERVAFEGGARIVQAHVRADGGAWIDANIQPLTLEGAKECVLRVPSNLLRHLRPAAA